MPEARSVIDTMLGEAGGRNPRERYQDLKHIASVMVNRARKEGVSLEDVIAAPNQFDAYGKRLPPGVESYRSLAERALTEVLEEGPTTSATYYATPEATKNLPGGLTFESETAGHQYFTDPDERAIRVANSGQPAFGGGYLASYAPTEEQPSAFDSVFGGFAARAPQTREQAMPTAGLLSDPQEGFSSPFGLLGDRITSGFGERESPRTPLGLGSIMHRGVDMALGDGAAGYPAEAIGGGVVTFAGTDRGYGNMVEVEHPDGTRSRYGHLQSIGDIAQGDQIARGTPLGLVGNTGRSTGPHLHLEVMDQEGRQIDPASVIDFDAATRVPTPSPSPGAQWMSAAPMEVERAGLAPADVAPGPGLLNPSLSEDRFSAGPVAQGYSGLRDSLMATNEAMGATDPSRFASGPVAQGYDGLRGGLLAQTMKDAQPSLASTAPTTEALGQNVSFSPAASTLPGGPGLLSNPATFAASLTGVQPNTAQTTAYSPGEVSTRVIGGATVKGPASPEIANPDDINAYDRATPRANVGSFPAAPETTGQKAKKVAGTMAGALLGGAALGPVGTLMGGLLGREMSTGKGLFSGAPSNQQTIGGLLSELGASINNVGSGARASYSVWGGGTPIGSQATATDGSRITQLGGGLIARTDTNGVTTTFNDRGNIVGSPASSRRVHWTTSLIRWRIMMGI